MCRDTEIIIGPGIRSMNYWYLSILVPQDNAAHLSGSYREGAGE